MTAIIATIGPASESPEMLIALRDAGVTHFRLNFSHGSHTEHGERFHRMRAVAPEVKIMLDSKGPELRTADMPGGEYITIEPGDTLTLTTDLTEQNTSAKILGVLHTGLTNDVVAGDTISIDSGLMTLTVREVTETHVVTDVIVGGVIKSRRHLNLIGKDMSLATITEKDEADLRFGAELGVDSVALSYVRAGADIARARELVPGAEIYAKIESQSGLDNAAEIIAAADGVMVARGDLGIETPYAEVPFRQIELIRLAKAHGKFAIVATEMMESMITKPRPTRAEVTDIAVAVWQGADAVMLSAETAVGEDPVRCVTMMREIAETAARQGVICQIS